MQRKSNILKTVILISFCFSCSVSQEIISYQAPQTDWQKYHFRASVKAAKVQAYKAVYKQDSLVMGKPIHAFIYSRFFDKKGHQTKKISGYNSIKWVYDYNARGQLIKATNYFIPPDIEYWYTFTYDSRGRCIKQTTHRPNNDRLSEALYTYNDKNQLIKKTAPSMNTFYTYQYNEQGFKTGKTQYNDEGKYNSKETYEYDEKGLIVKTNQYNFEARLYAYTTYSYNEKKFRLTKIMHNADGSLLVKTKNHYLKYNPQGDWVLKQVDVDDKPAYFVKRKLTYYP